MRPPLERAPTHAKDSVARMLQASINAFAWIKIVKKPASIVWICGTDNNNVVLRPFGSHGTKCVKISQIEQAERLPGETRVEAG